VRGFAWIATEMDGPVRMDQAIPEQEVEEVGAKLASLL
jgi:hypothetical protein